MSSSLLSRAANTGVASVRVFARCSGRSCKHRSLPVCRGTSPANCSPNRSRSSRRSPRWYACRQPTFARTSGRPDDCRCGAGDFPWRPSGRGAGSRSGGVAIAVLFSLSIAVLIERAIFAQGMTFISQTASAAVLCVVFIHHGTVTNERLIDVVIGGGIALVFSMLLFPANPVVVLRNARAGVLAHCTTSSPSWWTRRAIATAVTPTGNSPPLISCTTSWAGSVRRAAPPAWCRSEPRGDGPPVASSARPIGRPQSWVYSPRVCSTSPAPSHPHSQNGIRRLYTKRSSNSRPESPSPTRIHARPPCTRLSPAGSPALHDAAKTRSQAVLVDLVESSIEDLQQVIEPPSVP